MKGFTLLLLQFLSDGVITTPVHDFGREELCIKRGKQMVAAITNMPTTPEVSFVCLSFNRN